MCMHVKVIQNSGSNNCQNEMKNTSVKISTSQFVRICKNTQKFREGFEFLIEVFILKYKKYYVSMLILKEVSDGGCISRHRRVRNLILVALSFLILLCFQKYTKKNFEKIFFSIFPSKIFVSSLYL